MNITLNNWDLSVKSQKNAHTVGRIQEVIIDPEKYTIRFFKVKSKDNQNKSVKWDAIQSVGANEILVRSADDLDNDDKTDTGNMISLSSGFFSKVAVIDSNNNKLGTVRNFQIKPESGEIDKIEFKLNGTQQGVKPIMYMNDIDSFKSDAIRVKSNGNNNGQNNNTQKSDDNDTSLSGVDQLLVKTTNSTVEQLERLKKEVSQLVGNDDDTQKSLDKANNVLQQTVEKLNNRMQDIHKTLQNMSDDNKAPNSQNIQTLKKQVQEAKKLLDTHIKEVNQAIGKKKHELSAKQKNKSQSQDQNKSDQNMENKVPFSD